ncbi:L-lactate dehydrogenase [Fusarium oxysporum f. sp. lycopersici 4287]|uniref:L-lactate dehydrogenase n=1 Tax=Fusarium oxysporum f. sp. lycopersici (strain 4287 / CBS 123668 / FGSC 9935 / NRRL 34936) TaxID=426428 RepID=A0A0J9W7R3_FUSO4|nr:L-lactate dehydrogenase [Fusarium oxysporum f. sp. lycopersici 4287]KAJ9419139.1 L-lactate dehydrogenase [Fusarium oxysporum]KNB18745.1 L-lactate dehydrogenase [Fusarium oxysporum f. sp. lycopersici 4287]
MDSGSRIAIVGVGEVGGAIAYNLTLGSIASELLLVELDLNLRNAQVEDLSDVAYSTGSSTRVRSATYGEAAQSDIVVITAASKHTLGQNTIDCTSRNTSMIREVMDAMKPFRSDTILLVVANPVDLLTSIAQGMSGLPKSQVIGSGTSLDTSRLRRMVASRGSVSPSSIGAFVVGVHGEDQVTAWSTATVGAVPISEVHMFSALDRARIDSTYKHRSRVITQGKGSAVFGIASISANLCCSILLDKREISPVCHFQPKFDCCLSMPAIIGRKGILSTLHLSLDDQEQAAIAASAKHLKDRIEWIQKYWWL